jgi:AsmA protein
LTTATGLKRLGFVLLAVIAGGMAVLTTAGYLISADTVRQRVLAEIREVTGLDPVLRGKASVSLFPSGSVNFADVALGDAKQPALVADRLTARLRFFPLLIGRVEIADVSLDHPRIMIEFLQNGQSNWSGLIDALTRSQAAAHRVAAFSEMRIDGGTVTIRDEARQFNETLYGVEFSLAWPSISKTFGATGRLIWRDAPLDASLTLADFAAALTGSRSGVKLRITGSPMKAAFDGAVSFKPALKIEGTLAADAPSLRNAMIWSGQKPLPGGGFGRFAIKAKTNVLGGTISLSSVNVELDGNSAEGVLTFAADGRQTLQGTLASEALDLTPYISTVRLIAANERAWNNGRITLDGLAEWTSISASRRQTSSSRMPNSGALRSPRTCVTAIWCSPSARRRPMAA